jgi:sec-independent protein translocase protein TatB
MFDFAWTEIALIGVVALIAIGPKDLPVAIKTVAGFVKKARKMAGEFQGHVDEMVREANLHEVRDELNKLRNFDIKGEIEKHVDSDGSLRSVLNENPMAPQSTYEPTITESSVETRPSYDIVNPAVAVEAPSFIPPTADIIPPPPVVVAAEPVAEPEPPVPPEPPAPPAPPAFVPPGIQSA